MMVGGRIATLEHTMEDVWTRVVDLFAARTVDCKFTFGAQDRNLETVPPHIHFERTGGSFQFAGTRASNGEFVRFVQSCDAYVWGLLPNEDFEKYQAMAALGLVVELIGALYAVAPSYDGGLNGLEIEYADETHVLKYGAQMILHFQFLAPLKWVTAEQFALIGGVNSNLNKRS